MRAGGPRAQRTQRIRTRGRDEFCLSECAALALLGTLLVLAAITVHAKGDPTAAPLPVATSQQPATPAPSHAAPPWPGPRARVYVLRVDFPDRASSRPVSDFKNPGGNGLVDRMQDYWKEVSLGRLVIDTAVSSHVYRLPKARARYLSRPGDLIRDAIGLATQPGEDAEKARLEAFAPDVVVVFFAGPGAESDMERRQPGLPWSNAYGGIAIARIGEQVLRRGMVVAEEPLHGLSPYGVLNHEFGHVLGLPELYAPGKAHEGIGVWGLMGQGTWLGMGERPPHPEAWSKLQLGWVDPIDVETTQRVRLPLVERSGQVVRIRTGRDGEVFLIENRARVGADRGLKGEGLLIWHVDESRKSFRRSQDDPRHKRLDLLTADRWPSDLDVGHARGGNRGDAGDPWADRRLGPQPGGAPSTDAYDGAPGRFAIRNISPAGEVMEFDVVFTGDGTTAPGPVQTPRQATPPARSESTPGPSGAGGTSED